MKKNRVGIYLGVALAIAILISIVLSVTKSMQSSKTMTLPIILEGQYRIDEGEWIDYSPDSIINALDGDLTFKGNIDIDLEIEGFLLNFYLNHISAKLYVDGELLMDEGNIWYEDYRGDFCGSLWASAFIEKHVTPETEIVIELHNNHNYGNAGAYMDFFGNITSGSVDTLQSFLYSQSNKSITSGIVIILMAFMIAGLSLFLGLSGDPKGGSFAIIALIFLSFGIFLCINVKDSFFRYNYIHMSSLVNNLSVLLYALFIGTFLVLFLSGKRRDKGRTVIFVWIIVYSVAIVLSTVSNFILYDFLFLLIPLSCIFLLVVTYLSLREAKKDMLPKVLAYLLVFGYCLDSLSAISPIFVRGMVMSMTFGISVLIALCFAIAKLLSIMGDHEKNKFLEKSLEESRIAMTISQIQPHFINNILNTIYHLIGMNPEKAQEAVSDFSSFLRANIDSLESNEPILFVKEMEHIEHYLNLEKLRFGSELNIEYDIQVDNFLVPAMSIQPIVENAVKYGVSRKRGGGTVKLSTRDIGDAYLVCIEDDGIGFDTEAEVSTEDRSHIGIKNTKRRLALIVDGSMEITSSVGIGTKVEIRIKKRGK